MAEKNEHERKRDHEHEHEVAGAVWFRAPRQRRRAPALNRERIVSAAVDRLDREGVEGLSLRGIAGELGVHATSLYWHVATKGDVLDLALDEVFAEIGLPEEHGAADWDELVLSYMRQLRAMLLRHPWAAALAGTRPLAGPNALACSEAVYAALDRAGLSGGELAAAAAAVSNLVIAGASTQAAWARQSEGDSRRALRGHIAAESAAYPTLAAHLPGFLGDWDTQFEIAARYLVKGIAAEQR